MPKDYKTWVGFAHVYCRTCKYENGSVNNEDERIRKCTGCRETQDFFYYEKNQHPIMIIKDEKGKNIGKLLE